MTEIPMCPECDHPEFDHGDDGCEALGRVPFPDGPELDCGCRVARKVERP